MGNLLTERVVSVMRTPMFPGRDGPQLFSVHLESSLTTLRGVRTGMKSDYRWFLYSISMSTVLLRLKSFWSFSLDESVAVNVVGLRSSTRKPNSLLRGLFICCQLLF